MAKDLVLLEPGVMDPEIFHFEDISSDGTAGQANPPQKTGSLDGCVIPLKNSIAPLHRLLGDGFPLRNRVETYQVDPAVDIKATPYPFVFDGSISSPAGPADVEEPFSTASIDIERFSPGEMITLFPSADTLFNIEVSRDSLPPIRVEKIQGMNYADRHLHEKVVYGKDHLSSKGSGNDRLPGQVQLPLRRQGKPALRTFKSKPSIWDLVYVVLQMP